MHNSGLPEAGDAVFTFPAPVLADPDASRAAAVPTGDHAAAARHRRDLALGGFLTLRREGGLRPFRRRPPDGAAARFVGVTSPHPPKELS